MVLEQDAKIFETNALSKMDLPDPKPKAKLRECAAGELRGVVLSMAGLIPMKGLEMERQRAGLALGRLAGGAQEHFAGMGSRLGFCIEEGKGMVMAHVSKLEMKGPEFGKIWPKFELDRVARSLCAGFSGWRSGVQRVGEERKADLARLLTRIREPQRLQCASLSMSSQQEGIGSQRDPRPLFQLAMSTEQVSKRLDGVPVYTVSNSANEFILISDVNSQKSLGMFCFRLQDAESLLSQVRDTEPSLGRGAKVVAVSLDKVEYIHSKITKKMRQ